MQTDLDLLQFRNRFAGITVKAEQQLMLRYKLGTIQNNLKAGKYYEPQLQQAYNEYIASFPPETDKYYFITICPYPDVKVADVKRATEKIFTKSWFKKYILVIEQRQHQIDKPFDGIHIHIILRREPSPLNRAKSDVIRELYSTTKNICGSKQSIDVKYINTQHELDTRLQYVLAKKSSKEKQLRQIVDTIFREKNNISPYYIEGEWQEDIITIASTRDFTSFIEE